MAGSPAPKIAYRSQATTSGGTTVTKPAGVAVGDVVIIASIVTGGAFVPITGWGSTSLTDGSNFFVVHYKVLTSGDVSGTWSGPNMSCIAIAYQGYGATTITVKSSKDDSGSSSATTVIPGFTPSSRSRGTITTFQDRDNTTPTSPSGFTSRFVGSGAGVGNFGYGVADAYFQGAGSVTWVGAGTNGQCGFLLEVT